MKKRLLAIALVLMLTLTLLPTAAFATEGEDDTSLGTTWGLCVKCKKITTFEILEVVRSPIMEHDRVYHWVKAQCTTCGNEQTFHPDGALGSHSGGTETPTCTTGKTCDKCGEEYGILGHDWGAWQSNNDNKTHTRSCKRDGCNAVDRASCGGDGAATCVTLGTCTGCGQQYYGEHSFPARWDWRSDTDVGRDAEYHWVRCLHCEEGKAHRSTHSFSPGNMYLKSAATCISLPVYYTNCSTCYYKGTDTYVYQWGQLDPTKHDGGTEIKNAKAATCTEKGYTGDTHCKGCDVKLSVGTDIPALDHDWGKWTANGDGTHTRTCSRDKSHSENGKCSGGKADCCHKAKCEVCGGAYGSLAPDNHSDLKHFPAKRATTHAEGNTEYWYCEGCGKYYADAEAKTEITQASTVIPATGRRPAPTTPAASVSSPKTGDAGVLLYAGMAILSLTGCAWLRRKEQ